MKENAIESEQSEELKDEEDVKERRSDYLTIVTSSSPAVQRHFAKYFGWAPVMGKSFAVVSGVQFSESSSSSMRRELHSSAAELNKMEVETQGKRLFLNVDVSESVLGSPPGFDSGLIVFPAFRYWKPRTDGTPYKVVGPYVESQRGADHCHVVPIQPMPQTLSQEEWHPPGLQDIAPQEELTFWPFKTRGKRKVMAYLATGKPVFIRKHTLEPPLGQTVVVSLDEGPNFAIARYFRTAQRVTVAQMRGIGPVKDSETLPFDWMRVGRGRNEKRMLCVQVIYEYGITEHPGLTHDDRANFEPGVLSMYTAGDLKQLKKQLLSVFHTDTWATSFQQLHGKPPSDKERQRNERRVRRLNDAFDRLAKFKAGQRPA